jgi:copper homeostasis protein
MNQAAAGRVRIVAAGSIREDNVRHILERTGVRDVHAALLAVEPSPVRFRNEMAPMGTTQGVEYQRFTVCPQTVRRFIEAAGQAIHPTSHSP